MTCKLDDLYRGNTRELTVTITVNDLPQDITGDNVVLTVKENPNDVTPVLTIDNSVHVDPTNGITEFTITDVQSAAFDVKQHYVEITWIRTSDAGQVTTLLVASLNVIEPIRDPA